MRILVVDDEQPVAEGIKFDLENDGYVVDWVCDGKAALELFGENRYDLIILDLMLPVIDGLTVCCKIREESNVPIIILTAKSEGRYKLIGFEYGADDYVTKPFDILELKARIRVILRRSGNVLGRSREFVEIGNIKADLIRRTVYVGKEAVDLTAKEFDMLATLMRSRGKIFSREKLLNDVWGKDFPADIRTVDVHVRRLREKLEKDDSNPQYILTKWGVGYYFKAE